VGRCSKPWLGPANPGRAGQAPASTADSKASALCVLTSSLPARPPFELLLQCTSVPDWAAIISPLLTVQRCVVFREPLCPCRRRAHHAAVCPHERCPGVCCGGDQRVHRFRCSASRRRQPQGALGSGAMPPLPRLLVWCVVWWCVQRTGFCFLLFRNLCCCCTRAAACISYAACVITP
jgi:hypothetical protein